MADLGNGTTLTFSGITANLIDINGPNLERGEVETTHMGTTTARTYSPDDLYDAGEVTCTVEYNGENFPITGAAATLTIDWGGAGNTSAVSAFLKSVSPGAAIGERMTADLSFKCSGAVS